MVGGPNVGPIMRNTLHSALWNRDTPLFVPFMIVYASTASQPARHWRDQRRRNRKSRPVDVAETLLCTSSCACFHSSISYLGFDLSTGRVVPLYVRTPSHSPTLVEYEKINRVRWSPEPGDLETEVHKMSVIVLWLTLLQRFFSVILRGVHLWRVLYEQLRRVALHQA